MNTWLWFLVRRFVSYGAVTKGLTNRSGVACDRLWDPREDAVICW